MKILQLDFDDLKNPIGGGQARLTYEFNRRLARNHEITVVTGRFPGTRDEIIDKIKYIRIGARSFPWNFLSFIWQAPDVIRRIPHDILIESFTPPVSTAFTPLFTKKPVVGMVHWLFAREMSQKYKLPFYWWESWGLRYYQNFVVSTEGYRKKILAQNPRAKVLVSFPAIDLPRKIQSKEKDYILFLGRIDLHQKGLDLLIKSFDQIADKVSTKLVIAGGGKDENKLLRLISKAKNHTKIEFVGQYDSKKRQELLGGSIFVCLPSRYEMAPLVAKEAMSFGKPLIIFDVLGVRESVSKKCAIYVRPFNTEAYASAIIELINNQTKRKKMGKSALQRMDIFQTWDEVVTEQEKFYLSLIFKRDYRNVSL